jgi:cyclophilin family peptidyl-prolyl cis-trans isomerase
VGLFSSKPGFNSYKYNKRFGGYRNEVRRVLNQHNSTKVATHKLKVIDAGIHTITSGGEGRSRGQATSSEINALISGLETAKTFNKKEIDGLRTVFQKELAQKDRTVKSTPMFGRPEGITSTRFSRNTVFDLSPEAKLKQELVRTHGKFLGGRLANEIKAVLNPAFKGGRGRLDTAEKNTALNDIKHLEGVTQRDGATIERILNSAFGEKAPTTTPTLHPLSTTQVVHKKSIELGVTPPPADGLEKNPSSGKAPVMHAPPVVKGVHLDNAAMVPIAINRALQSSDDNIVLKAHVSDGAKTVDKEAHETSKVESHIVSNEKPNSHDESKHDAHHAPPHEEATQATKPQQVKPLSSRSSFQERIARRRAERTAFNEYEQSTTQFTRASHESLTEKATPVGKSGTKTFAERMKEREGQRNQNNETKQKNGGTEHATEGMHTPSFSSHVTADFSKPRKPEGEISHDDTVTQAHNEESSVDQQSTTEEQSMASHEEGVAGNAEVPGAATDTRSFVTHEFKIDLNKPKLNDPVVRTKSVMHVKTVLGEIPHKKQEDEDDEEVENKKNSVDTRETEEGLPNNYQEKLAELREFGPRILGNSLMTEFEIMARGDDNNGVRDEFYPDWKDEDFRRLITDLKKGVSQSPSVSPELSQETVIVNNINESVGDPHENPSGTAAAKKEGAVSTENTQDTHDDDSRTVQNPSMKLGVPPTAMTDTESVDEEQVSDDEQEQVNSEEPDIEASYRRSAKLRVMHSKGNDTGKGKSNSSDAFAADAGGPIINLATSVGDISIRLFTHTMPNTAGNFLKRAVQGSYNDSLFLRVVEDYVIQAGAVHAGTNAYTESQDKPSEPYSNVRGTVSVVSADKNPDGSVFSINVVNNSVLDGRYSVFANVVSGMNVVDTISKMATDQNESPKEPVRITGVTTVDAVQTARELDP